MKDVLVETFYFPYGFCSVFCFGSFQKTNLGK